MILSVMDSHSLTTRSRFVFHKAMKTKIIACLERLPLPDVDLVASNLYHVETKDQSAE